MEDEVVAKILIIDDDHFGSSALERHPILAGAQRDRAITLDALGRILHQVDQDLLELLRVGSEANLHRRFQIQLDGLLFESRLEQELDFLQHRLCREREEFGIQRPGQLQKVLHKLVQPIRLLADGGSDPVFRSAVREGLLQGPEPGRDGGERLLDFVRLPDGKFFEVGQLVFGGALGKSDAKPVHDEPPINGHHQKNAKPDLRQQQRVKRRPRTWRRGRVFRRRQARAGRLILRAQQVVGFQSRLRFQKGLNHRLQPFRTLLAFRLPLPV